MLRLGAEYRYYPCPLVSVRFRDAVYSEIGHTIMKVLADFRNFAYTLPGVRGLAIHMQDRTTDVMFPKNRYDQVIRGLNNSNDHVLAYASNFSINADSHLVCIQTNTGDESNYQTQAINIHNKPRRGETIYKNLCFHFKVVLYFISSMNEGYIFTCECEKLMNKTSSSFNFSLSSNGGKFCCY